MSAPTFHDMVTSAEAGEILGVSRERAMQFVRTGRIVGAVQVGRVWFLPRVAVENFAKIQRFPGPINRKPKPDNDLKKSGKSSRKRR